MSVQAMSYVFTHSKATSGARLVLLAVANHADDAGENSWCSVARLAQEARLSERQTRYALRELEKMGELKKEGRRGLRADRQTNLYSMPFARGAIFAPRNEHEGQSATARGAICDSTRGNPLPPNHPITIQEPSKKKTPGGAVFARRTEFFLLWEELYSHQFGGDYALTGRDKRCATELMEGSKLPPGELIQIAVSAWSKRGQKKFFRCQLAISIAGFCSYFNEIVDELKTSGNVSGAEAGKVHKFTQADADEWKNILKPKA